MDRAGLITLEQARAAGLSFDEPEPRACPHCGAALEPLGAALAGKVAWVSAASCPCEGAPRARVRGAQARQPCRQGGGGPPGEGTLSCRHPQALLDCRGRPPGVRRVHRLVRRQRGRRALHTRGRRSRQDSRSLRRGQAVRRGRLRRRFHDGQGHARACEGHVRRGRDRGRRRPIRQVRHARARRPRQGGRDRVVRRHRVQRRSTRATRTCARPSSRRTTRRARWRTGSRGAASASRRRPSRAGSNQTCRPVYLGGRDRRRRS